MSMRIVSEGDAAHCVGFESMPLYLRGVAVLEASRLAVECMASAVRVAKAASSSSSSSSTLRGRQTDGHHGDNGNGKGDGSDDDVPSEMSPNQCGAVCRLCLETACGPCAAPCGHVYCWSCLSRWCSMKPMLTAQCPMCRRAVALQTVVPIEL